MEIFNADRQRNLEINNLLQRIKYKASKQKPNTFIYFPLFTKDNNKIEYKENLLTISLFEELKNLGAIKIINRTNDEINKTIEEDNKSEHKTLIIEGYSVKPILPKFSQLCEEYERKGNEKLEEKSILQKTRTNDSAPLFIKNIRLDEQNYLLEINKGEKIISFKSKKKGGGLEKETKLFKILFHLWEFRRELKNNKVLEKGDFASLDNLTKGSGSESPTAVYKQIQRLNNRFKKEGVAIEIRGQNEKYHLIINKT